MSSPLPISLPGGNTYHTASDVCILHYPSASQPATHITQPVTCVFSTDIANNDLIYVTSTVVTFIDALDNILLPACLDLHKVARLNKTGRMSLPLKTEETSKGKLKEEIAETERN